MILKEDRIKIAKLMVEDDLLTDSDIARYSSIPKWEVEKLRKEMGQRENTSVNKMVLTNQEMRLIKTYRLLSDDQKDVILKTAELFNFPFVPL